MNLAGRIRAERKARRISQEELARRVGMSLRAFSSLERGEAVDPHISTLRGIAAALEIDIAELLEEPVPLGDAGEEPAVIVEKAWRRGELFVQRLSYEERVKYIEKAIDILRHYYELGQRERAKMEEDLAWHGSSYVWHSFYYSALQPAMERDGVLMHASFVVDGPATVSDRERMACEKILDFDREMQYLLADMRGVDEKNNASTRADGSQLTSELSSWLEEGASMEVASRRGPEEA